MASGAAERQPRRGSTKVTIGLPAFAKADIFISYAREDRDWVQRLAGSLEAAGWSVWWDPRIPAGKTFRQVIEAALAGARCVVVVWSKEAVKSKWVIEEADEGLRRDILVPVFKEKVSPPLGFRNIQAADLSAWEGDDTAEPFRTFVEDIKSLIDNPKALRRGQKAKPRPRPEPAPAKPRAPVVKLVIDPARAVGFPVPTLIRVPAGAFPMGTSDEHMKLLCGQFAWAKEWKSKGLFSDEQPHHTVELEEYQIAKSPVTNAEYEVFVKDTRHPGPGHWKKSEVPEGLADHPAVNVSWDDAVAYCQWLTKRLQEAGALSAKEVIRLPTEAEWEKAARGADGRWFPWGQDWDPTKCNSSEGGVGTTTRVGQYSPRGDSPYGLADMAGNVWEWCADFYGKSYYRESPRRNPTGPANGDSRVLRGGSFVDFANFARCAFRIRYFPNLRNYFIGFRVVASPF